MTLARHLLAAALALLPLHGLLASDIESSNWSETAASNNATPPHGFPEGMAPSAVNDAAREMMRALKSDWNRSHATVAGGGTGDAIAVVYAVAPTLANGQVFCWESTAANTGPATLNVNSTGARAVRKGSGATALGANDILSGAHVCVSYDLSSDLYHLLTPNLTGFAAPGSANSFTAAQTFATTGTASNVILRSTDAGAAAAPVLTLDRDSASQADGDDGGAISFQANDDSGSPNDTVYAEIGLGIPDSGDGSEDGAIEFRTRVAGVLAQRMQLLAGLSLDVGGGLDNGAGTVTADGYFVDSARVPTELSVQVFTGPGTTPTYTAPADLVYAIVEVQAPGGGGGGADANSTAGACGAGGGGGGYSRELLTAATIGASQTVTLGAVGTGGTTIGGDGGNGGTTSFGALLSATGGAGGTGSGSNSDNSGAQGGPTGDGSGGTFNTGGNAGGGPCATLGTSKAFAGSGGNAVLGAGGRALVQTNGTDRVGNNGDNYGGGGSGATDDDNSGSAGGDGGEPIVIVWEFRA